MLVAFTVRKRGLISSEATKWPVPQEPIDHILEFHMRLMPLLVPEAAFLIG
jgi:hypothetical protein